jgi:arabinogalactan oligomer/maltooligosaccharide transport system permease protein
VLLALVVLIALLVVQRLIEQGLWLAVVGVALVTMAILAVYSTRRAIPLKYLLPGLLLLVTLQVWPIVYTVATAFTNYGDGHLISKQESVDAIVANSVREVEGSERYRLSVAVPEGSDVQTGELTFLLTDAQGESFVGTKEGLDELTAEGVEKAAQRQDHQGCRLHRAECAPGERRADIREFAVPTEGGGGIKPVGLSEAFEGRPTVSYDEGADKLTDSATGKTYIARDANWVPEDGRAIPSRKGGRRT